MTILRLFILSISFFALPFFAFMAVTISTNLHSYQSAQKSEELLSVFDRSLTLIEMMSIERGPANALFAVGSNVDQGRISALDEARKKTDAAFHHFVDTFSKNKAREDDLDINALSMHIMYARSLVDRLIDTPLKDRQSGAIRTAVETQFSLIEKMMPSLSIMQKSLLNSDHGLFTLVYCARLAAEIREYTGRLGSILSAPLSNNRLLTDNERLAIEYTKGKIDNLNLLLRQTINESQSPTLQEAYTKAHQTYYTIGLYLIDSIVRNSDSYTLYITSGASFVDQYVPSMKPYIELRDLAIINAYTEAKTRHNEARNTLFVSFVAGVTSILALVLIVFAFYRRVLAPLIEIDEKVLWIGSDVSPMLTPESTPTPEILRIAKALDYLDEQLLNGSIEQRQAIDLAQEASNAKSDFLATISHEIRTPMMGIIGSVDLLLHSSLDEKQERLAQVLKTSAQSLLVLMNDLLDVSRIESGSFVLESRVFCPYRKLEDLVSLVRLQAEAKGLYVFLDTCDGLRATTIRSDENRFFQIALNLINNAIKFTEAGFIAVRMRISSFGGNQFLQVDIEDTGIGIAEDQHQKLFRRFSQLETHNQRRFGGAGLGLAISKDLAEALGGGIGFKSTPGQGSTFFFTVPLLIKSHVTDLDVTVPTVDTIYDQEPTGSYGRLRDVLIVDDSDTNQLLLSLMLEELGISSVCVDSGRAAIAEASKKGFDLILMDIQMPDIDGIETAFLIRETTVKNAVTPIIALSGSSFEDSYTKAHSGKISEFVSKPITIEKLKGILDKWMISHAVES